MTLDEHIKEIKAFCFEMGDMKLTRSIKHVLNTLEILRTTSNSCYKIFDHKWLDSKCIEDAANARIEAMKVDNLACSIAQYPITYSAVHFFHEVEVIEGIAQKIKTAIQQKDNQGESK